MNTPGKLVAFAAGLAVVLGGGAAAGALVDPQAPGGEADTTGGGHGSMAGKHGGAAFTQEVS